MKEACKRIGQTKDFTPIMKAAHLGRAKMIDLLLDYGANPNEIDSIGYSALMRAVMSKNLESVKVLVEAGAIVTYVQKTAMMDLGLSAIKLAQMTGRKDMVDVLKEAGLPDGVINMIFTDGKETAEKVLAHPDFAGLHFTGSTKVFQGMWKMIGDNIHNYKSYNNF